MTVSPYVSHSFSMQPHSLFLLASVWTCVCESVTLNQSPLSITKADASGKTAYLDCLVQGCSYVHWYEQKEGKGLKRILYVATGTSNPQYDEGFIKNKFQVDKKNSLIMSSVNSNDEATYYCACVCESVTLNQSPLSITKADASGKTAYMDCIVQGCQHVHWYQQKEGKGLKWILYVATGGYGALTLIQPQISITTREKAGTTTTYIDCIVQDCTHVHWYQQKAGEGPKRILYVQTGSQSSPPMHDEGFNKVKFQIYKKDNSYSLTVELPLEIMDSHRQQVELVRRLSGGGGSLEDPRRGSEMPQQQLSQQTLQQVPALYIPKDKRIPDFTGHQLKPGDLSTEEWLEKVKSALKEFNSHLTSCMRKTHCDTSDYWIKHFGEGTKLLVSSKSTKKPTAKILPPSPTEIEIHKEGTFLCNLKGFFPNVIKVEWAEEGRNTHSQLNAVTGEISQDDEAGTSYSINSWLTVSENDVLKKRYVCQYWHEDISQSKNYMDKIITRQPETVADIERDVCPDDFGNSNSTDISEGTGVVLNFIQKAAYITYILLLLKSICYTSILIFICKMKARAASQDKTLAS
ncbi:T-cell receptor gamma alternate reading frame protein [Microcaecilia unicolor]|uniref:TCR gamma alternate reading frame protein n=1 Tax=Microcaecilia unicolor TaxID=1415580 RepID=UPI00118531A5|nr:TCR gamma alternate reading frame protein [Microcaecilia unicolor]